MTLGTHLRQNAVAYLALVVALSTGSAYAADKIANGSVTTKKLAVNAVTSTKIKNGAVRAIDLHSGAVTSFTVADGSLTSNDLATNSITGTDIQDGTVSSGDIKDDSVVRADIGPGVIPQDADVIFSTTGQSPAATPAAAGLNSFAFALPRPAKIQIEFFAGEIGVDCAGGGQGQVGMYLDGAPRPGTLTDVPASADAGALRLVSNPSGVTAGNHVLTIGEQCASGAYGPTVPAKRITWTVHLLAR